MNSYQTVIAMVEDRYTNNFRTVIAIVFGQSFQLLSVVFPTVLRTVIPTVFRPVIPTDFRTVFESVFGHFRIVFRTHSSRVSRLNEVTATQWVARDRPS